MSDEMVVRQCAPTLASIKTGSLFNAPFDSEEEMRAAVRELNGKLRKHGIRVIPFRYLSGRGLIYLYRPDCLARDLCDRKALELLRECGYTQTEPNRCLSELKKRLCTQKDFPHEIGLFLGYPPRDVDGFMHCREQCLLCGLWKVYHDPDSAQEQFTKCNACTQCLLARIRSGWRLEELAVG